MSVRIVVAALLAAAPAVASAQAQSEAPDACTIPLALVKDRVVVAVEPGPVAARAAFVVKPAAPASSASPDAPVPANAPADTATGRVVWATRGEASVPVPDGLGEAVLDPATRTLALDVPVSRMRPGEWAFGLSLARTIGGEACPEEQPLDVKINVPAPTLTPSVATVAWSVVWPWDALRDPEARVVQLTETGGSAGVRALSATWVPLADGDGAAPDLGVECAPRTGEPSRPALASGPSVTTGAAAPADPAGGIAAGGVRTLDCTLTGIGTLGAQSGTIRLDAPSLATPTDVKVTVTTRLTKIVIPVLIVLAIFFSRALRTGLQAKVAALEAKDRAERAVTRARLAREGSGDEAFRADVEAAIQVFLRAIRTQLDAAEVDARITALDAAVTTAEAALKGATEAANREVQALEKALSPAWRLPPEVVPTVEEARAEVRQARAALGARNPTLAQRSADAAKLVTARLASTVGGFVERLQPLVDAPLPQVRPLTGPLREQRLLLAGASTDALARLQALHLAWEPLERGLDEALGAAQRDLVGAIELYGSRQEAGAALLPRAVALRARAAPRTLAERVQLHQVLVSDATALRTALLAGLPADRGPADVTAALDMGEWARAVALAGGAGRGPLGDAPGFAPEASFAPAAPSSTPTPSLPPTATVPPVQPWSPVWSGLGDAAPTREALEAARDKYFLVTTVAITVLGSVQFSGGWVGTLDDLVNAFAWGLGLDASSAFLFGLATELRTRANKPWPAPPSPPATL